MRILMVVFAAILVTVLPFPVAAQTNPALDRLDDDFRAMLRVLDVAKEPDEYREILRRITETDIDELREPRANGTYRWASLQREEEGRVSEERGVEKVADETTLTKIEATAPRAYRVVVSVPRKRNLISSNNRVWLRDVVVQLTDFDGKVTRETLTANVWIRPGDSHALALPIIARSARAEAYVAVESGDKKAVANLALLQAKLVDDSRSPHYPAVRRLLDIRRRLDEGSIRTADLRSTIDEALLSLPGEMDRRAAERAAEINRRLVRDTGAGSIAAGDASRDVIAALDEIARLMNGTLSDQRRAQTRLQELLERLR
jgi:hypothetical protein